MTNSLVSGSTTIDIGLPISERIRSASNLQVMPFPTSPASSTDVFDYSGVERRLYLRGVFAAPTMAETTLSLAAVAGDSTLLVGDTTNFATAGTIRVDQEYITYTGKTLSTLTGCTRGAWNTTAAAHAISSRVLQNPSVLLHALESGQQSTITYNSDQFGVLKVKVENVETDISAGSPSLINYSFELVESSTTS